MEKIKIESNGKLYEIESIYPQTPNIMQIIFADEVPAEWGDITLYTSGDEEATTITGYETIYRNDGRTIYLSNDGSIYQAPTDTPQEPPEPYIPTLPERRLSKLQEIAAACAMAIAAGFDVQLTDGNTEHYSLTETDQINLSAAVAAVQAGAQVYPYHADGTLCKLYQAADIVSIGTAATEHKLYHTTYCNHLNAWIRRAESFAELDAISYGAALPADLADNMAAIIAAVSGGGA